MIHLILSSGILSVTNLYYHFWRLYIKGYFFNLIDRDPIKEFLTRVLYLVRVLNQFFVLSSMMWTICISVALCYTLTLYHHKRIKEWKIMTLFYFLAVFIPLCDMMFWGTYFQFDVNSDGSLGAIPFKTGAIFETIYYGSHAGYLAIGFLVNLTLLIVNWRVIKSQTTSMMDESPSEIRVIYNLSWYAVPSLISCIWQVIGYILLAIWSSTTPTFALRFLFNLIQYPYSFFFPLQGLLNAFVFYFNRRRLISCFKGCSRCCKREQQEAYDPVE